MRFFLTIIVTFLLYQNVYCADNRAAMATKAVNLGVTFYTASQIQTILVCADPQFYSTPTNSTAIISTAKNCIINNSGSQALTALSLYTNINSCLSPDDIVTLAESWATPFQKLVKVLLNKIVKKLKACKAAGSTQEVCLQKLYAIAKAAITKNYVDKICKKFVKQNLSKTQYSCALKYAPKVVNITGYGCATLTIS